MGDQERMTDEVRGSGVKEWTPPILAATVSLGFFGSLLMLAVVNVSQTAHDILIGMVGVLGTSFITVVNYYFGSSSGSAKKTEILANGEGTKP